jgi:dihydropteroate synthase
MRLLREALDLWSLMDDQQRAEAAEEMRPRMVEMVVQRGARTPDEVRNILEMFVAAAEAELDADEPTPMPQLNRAVRRATARQ